MLNIKPCKLLAACITCRKNGKPKQNQISVYPVGTILDYNIWKKK